MWKFIGARSIEFDTTFGNLSCFNVNQSVEIHRKKNYSVPTYNVRQKNFCSQTILLRNLIRDYLAKAQLEQFSR